LGAADGFDDFPSKGPPRSGVVQLASKDCDPESPRFVAGAQPGLIVLRYGVGDAAVVKDFTFTPFASESRFSVYEPSRGTEQGRYVDTLPKRPLEARWQADANGKQRCRLPNGNEVRETKTVFAIVKGKRIVAFAAHSSGLKPIADMLDHCARLSVKIETLRLHGPIISKWAMATLEKREGTYRWWVPRPTLIGKLGDEKGPTLAEVVFAKQVRESFRQGGSLWNEAPEAPPTAPDLPPIARGKQTVTSGRAPDEAPPISVDDGYAGVDPNDVEF
jgi:hypothetical protein